MLSDAIQFLPHAASGNQSSKNQQSITMNIFVSFVECLEDDFYPVTVF